MSAIAAYLAELERELKARRAERGCSPKVSDHLRASAAEVAAAGVDHASAEEAVARFGAAALVAPLCPCVATTRRRAWRWSRSRDRLGPVTPSLLASSC